MISPHRLLPYNIFLLKNNQSPVIYGDGTQTQDFTYVMDVVNGTVLSAQVKNKDLYGDPINIGTGINTSVNNIIEILKSILKKQEIQPIFYRKTKEPLHTQADIQKAKNILGWIPKTALLDGLRLTINRIGSIHP